VHRFPTTELSTTVVWHGHTADSARLVQAALRHCTCARDGGPDGNAPLCGTHQILADQHTLDHLAFARSVLNRLVEEEWRAPATPETRSEHAEWSAFFVRACASDPDARPSQGAKVAQLARPDRLSPTALGVWLLSVLALVLILGVHGPGGSSLPAPVGHPLASWQTR
jgi:hypothetical protein